MGPVEVLVLSFPRAGLVAGVGPLLEELVATGHLQVADAILATRDSGSRVVISDLDDSIIFGWSTISPHPRGLLSSADADLATSALAPGAAALLLAIEHTWPERLAERAADSGGQIELHARIDAETVAAAIDDD